MITWRVIIGLTCVIKQGSRENGCRGWLTDYSIWAVDCGGNGEKDIGNCSILCIALSKKLRFWVAGPNQSNDDVYAADG